MGASFGKKNTTFISLDMNGDLDNSNKFTEICSFTLISGRLFYVKDLQREVVLLKGG